MVFQSSPATSHDFLLLSIMLKNSTCTDKPASSKGSYNWCILSKYSAIYYSHNWNQWRDYILQDNNLLLQTKFIKTKCTMNQNLIPYTINHQIRFYFYQPIKDPSFANLYQVFDNWRISNMLSHKTKPKFMS